tara:strand:+ start:17634 stop:18590 length:957 start_codon:yes stop_codon:yes gene_type:complete
MAILGNNTAGRALPNIGFFASQSWTPPYSMQAYVYVVGGGGSGAATQHSSSNRSTGGGAGGCAVSLLTLLSSVAYTISIGAGGARKQSTLAGAAGSSSSFSGSGITTMSAFGGIGGVSASSGTATGAAGGAASGGNICNNTGGAGGDCSNANYNVSGGGGVGLWSTGNKGGAGTSNGFQSAAGGMLNYPTGALVTGTDYTNSPYNGKSAKPTMAPFDIISNYAPQANLLDSGSVSFYGNQQLQAGAFSSAYPYINFTSYGQVPASPFQGGASFCASGTTPCFAGAGGLGAGGGASYGSTVISGAGGDGAVLIFPVDMV